MPISIPSESKFPVHVSGSSRRLFRQTYPWALIAVHNVPQPRPAEVQQTLAPVTGGKAWVAKLRALPARPSMAEALALRDQFNTLRRDLEKRDIQGNKVEQGGTAKAMDRLSGVQMDDLAFKRLLALRRLCLQVGGSSLDKGILQSDFQAAYQYACIQKAVRYAAQRHPQISLSIINHMVDAQDDTTRYYFQRNSPAVKTYQAKLAQLIGLQHHSMIKKLVQGCSRHLRLPYP